MTRMLGRNRRNNKGGEMNTERDKFLTEAMGQKYHRGRELHDYSTWPAFGVLWEWAQQQEWFDLFQCCLYYHEYLKHCHRPGDERLDNDKVLHNELIHPDRFADAVCAFLKDRA